MAATLPSTAKPVRKRATQKMELLPLGCDRVGRGVARGRVLGWHSSGGTVDPSVAANARHMSRTTAVINSAILVFREGLETILVLAAITASFRGANSVYKRPVAIGGGIGLLATVGTWFAAIGIIDCLRWQRPQPAGRHRHPGDHRAAGRDELVLPQGLLDRLDLPPPQAPQGPAERRSADPHARAPCSASGCWASPRSTARALRSSSSCRTCA